MSGAQTSTFADPNILYKTLSGAGMQEVEQNRLLNVQRQQDIAANNTEVVARAASALIDPSLYPTEEARAAAYGPIIKRLKADGYAPNAPDYYPGFQHLQLTARLGTPSADLFKQQQNQAGWGQITGDGTGTTSTGGGGGGGTNAPPGTSTPTTSLNLADIHPDLTQFTLPSGVGLTVAKSAAPQFQGLLTDLEAAGYKLDPNTTGGYNPRNIAGTNTPSQHAHGLAIDVNWQRNPRGANTPADIPPDLARKLAAKWGLTWGGDWQGADRDPMHFEVARGSGPGTDHPAGVATGWKANNPLNLTADTGGVVTPGGARLASFGSMADGVAATAAKLQSYQTDRGLDTVRKMYTEWHKGSPVNEADMQRIAGAMGVGVDQPFQLDPTKTAAWITAAQPGETGTAGKRLSQADITAGVRQASVGAPGAPTAPAVVAGDVGRPGDVPPPPWGAPGAYGGGGMGAVIGGQPAAARATIPAGRPTGPPVITDQPAGSNVVAGPPGVATVGAPQPPGPAVPGNVAAINAGIVGAGGTAATAPYDTPTPARYAGTAAAPSVEAPPQPGWGTGIGSGYGPQNALAPPPPPPAAAVVAQQQPPAPVQPAARPAAPAPGGMLAGLLPDQVQAVLALRRSGGTPAQGLAMIEHFKEVNATAAHQTLEEQRQQEQLRLSRESGARAEEDAARKRAQDADPIKGTDDKANADRLLLKYVDGILDGTATPAARRLYAEAAQYYLKPQMQWIDDPTDPTKKQMVPVPGQLPEGFPHPSFKPGEQQPQAPTAGVKTDFKPLPETERKQLIDTATRIDQETQQRNTFKPEYAGFGNAAIGEFANAVARNNPIASKADTARAEWWQNYQRYKLAVRQGISGQSLTASELGEFDKADIHPGMTAQAVRDNLLQQDKILRTAHERRVGSLAFDRFSPDAIRAASGVDPSKVTVKPLTESGASKPDAAPHPPGFKVIIP